MKKNEFFNRLEEIMELDPNTIKGDQKTIEYPSWDSLAAVQYIALVDSEFNIVPAGEDIIKCETFNDLAALAGIKE